MMKDYNYNGSIIDDSGSSILLFILLLFASESFYVFYGYYIFNKVSKINELSNVNVQSIEYIGSKRMRIRSFRSKGNPLDIIFDSQNYYKLESKEFKYNAVYIVEVDEYELENLKYKIKKSDSIELFYEKRESPKIGKFFYVHQIETPSWKLRENYDDYYYKELRFKWISIFLVFFIVGYTIKEIYTAIRE